MDTTTVIAEFVARWSLDAQVTEFLTSLDESVLASVVNEFAPRDNTKDKAGKLYAFARSISNRHTTQAQLGPDLETFATKWALDDAGVTWLTSLPLEVSSILVQQFDPKEDTQNVNAKMRGFAKSIQARFPGAVTGDAGLGSRQVVNAAAAAAGIGAYDQSLNDFIMRWGIEQNAHDLLRSLPPDVQATVMAQFDPKGDTKNVTGKLLGFARSVAAGRQHLHKMQIVDSFAMYWGLDEGTVAFLHGLPEEVKAKVIQEFDPKAGTRDVNGKLRMFATGILSGPTKKGSGRGSAEAAPRDHTPVIAGAGSIAAVTADLGSPATTADASVLAALICTSFHPSLHIP